MSNFNFLQPEWTELHENAVQAERLLRDDPRSACFYARRGLETLLHWLYTRDPAYSYPYDQSLNNLLNTPSFKNQAPQMIAFKADYIRKIGNKAVHSTERVRDFEALNTLKELFHICYWLARTYTRGDPGALPAQFDEALIPPASQQVRQQSAQELQWVQTQLQAQDEQLRQQNSQLIAYQAELEILRRDTAALRSRNSRAAVDDHDYNEAETRKYLIDVLLRESGWDPEAPDAVEYRVEGMPNRNRVGYVDYVLWGKDGLPLAVVEAKRTTANPEKGRHQAKLYADCLAAKFKRRPLIFYTNGLETWLWDDLRYPPRAVQGFYNRDELERLIQQRNQAKPPAGVSPRPEIINRYYQQAAIRAICEHLQRHFRRALLVMATGTGKTRTVIALVDVLMRAGWVKHVLFLADRTSLVRQALGAFKKHLPESNPVSVLDGKEDARHARVVLSTYHSMINLIDSMDDNNDKIFGPGHFDLVIIDEAHRSVYHKFGAIFEYFDSLLIGLTATPKNDVDRNTYQLFQIENGIPNFNYELEQAVEDGYLVPPQAVSVPLKFQREGIHYDDLSDDEKMEWELLDWGEDAPPDHINASALNQWLFNTDTVDKVLQNLMENGIKVKGGDRLGKTIIFAKNHQHAEFILQRFDANYPALAGRFAQVIDNYVNYAQSLIDDFSKKDNAPHIAISVDMLDTGIDIPEVVNLVFFKAVHSKTKFIQMIGRGTRLCPDLYGPGLDKEEFAIFDYCMNFEYFDENPQGFEGQSQVPLSQQLFRARLELLDVFSKDPSGENSELYAAYADELHHIVAELNLNNFIIRPQRRYVEPFRQRARWNTLSSEDTANLYAHVSGLPGPQEEEEESAKRFDLLIFHLQLARLSNDQKRYTLENKVMKTATQLLEKTTIPMVRAQVPLLQRVLESEWWDAANPAALEHLRQQLRGITQFIDHSYRNPLYTNFTDELGQARDIEMIPGHDGVDLQQYKRKALLFVESHLKDQVVRKVRLAMQLTEDDLAALEELFFQADGLISREVFERVYGKGKSLPEFIRSLKGLDRSAAKEAFNHYLDNTVFTSDQITFINYIIEHLAANGSIREDLLYQSPFTDINDQGIEGVFPEAEIVTIFSIIRRINESLRKVQAVGEY